MDLKQYKSKIRDQLLHGMEAQARKEKAIATGDYVAKGGNSIMVPHYKIPKGDYDEMLARMNSFKGPTISMPGYVHSRPDIDTDDETDGGSFVGKNVIRRTIKKVKPRQAVIENESEDESETGGKVHFVKSMKKFGKDFGHAMKKAGINEATKVIAQEGVKFAKNNIGKLITGAEEVLPEALPIAEEAAPLMLAAGMKPKRTRKVSQKEANRHALIRKLMKQHGCTLAEASRHIKEEGLSY